MVARRGNGWSLAPSLIALEDQINARAPRRSKRADGSIGDQSHRTRASDHNPSLGWVTAADFTHDPAGGFNSYAFAQDLARRRDPRVKYIISNGFIWTPARGWKPYTGPNPHSGHVHVSVFNTPEARNNLSSWFSGSDAPSPTPSTPHPTPHTPTPLDRDTVMASIDMMRDRAKWATSILDTLEPDMFVVIEGVGFFAQVGNVTIPLGDMATYAQAKNRSDQASGHPVDTMILPNVGDIPRDAFLKLVNQTLVAQGKPSVP